MDVVTAVKESTSDGRVGASFDAAAAPSSLDQAVGVTSARGRVINVAAWERPVAFNPTTLLFREVSVHGSLAYTSADFEAAIEHARTREEVLTTMITSVLSLDDVIRDGFERLSTGGHDEVKVMVRLSRSAEFSVRRVLRD